MTAEKYPSDFTWWTAALAASPAELKKMPRYAEEPQHGFYRQKNRDGILEPIAYWRDEATGELRCHINGKQPTGNRAIEVWPYASMRPISAETYWQFMDTRKWPDVDQAAHDAAAGPAIDPETDPVGSLKAELAAAQAGAGAYKVIESDEAAARAQTLRSTLTGIKGKAEKAYEERNRPLLDQQQELRKIWFPIRDDADGTANALRKAMGAWNDVKLAAAKAAREAQEKAEREAAQKVAAEQEAHRRAVAAAEAASQPPPEPPPAAAPPPVVKANAPAPSTVIRGGSGRAASVRIIKTVAVDDEAAVYAFLKQDEVSAGLIAELIQRLAQRAFDAGQTVPGIHIEEKSDIR